MPEVTLRPMTAEEFLIYLPWAKAEYADEVMQNTGISAEAAACHSEDSFRDLVPEGVNTPGHQLLVATDPDTGERVGLLWLTTQRPRGTPAMWIYDIYVEEPLRGKGYGRRLLELAEEEARRAGLDRMELNVARDNEGARALYESMGYAEMSRQMYKELPER
jgi:ribosomal protein S18 acetylase RimI-like enzyme